MKSGANLDFELLMAHIFEGAGIGHTQIYKVWRGMIRRCHNKAYHRYHDYGGRGITVCDEWRYDFHSFLSTRPTNKELELWDFSFLL